MDKNWGWDTPPQADAHPYGNGRAERVVPAEGDPEVPLYREQVRRSQGFGPRYRILRSDGPRGTARRGGLRGWVMLAAIAMVGLLVLRPLLALAALAFALLAALLVLALLAGGALWLAVRFALGGRYPNDAAGAGQRGGWQRLAWRMLRQAWTRGG
jgi:hypothetical protein